MSSKNISLCNADITFITNYKNELQIYDTVLHFLTDTRYMLGKIHP